MLETLKLSSYPVGSAISKNTTANRNQLSEVLSDLFCLDKPIAQFQSAASLIGSIRKKCSKTAKTMSTAIIRNPSEDTSGPSAWWAKKKKVAAAKPKHIEIGKIKFILLKRT